MTLRAFKCVTTITGAVSTAYQWYFGGAPITGQTSTTVIVDDTVYAGANIFCVVSGTDSNGRVRKKASNVIALGSRPGSAPTAMGIPSISSVSYDQVTLTLGTDPTNVGSGVDYYQARWSTDRQNWTQADVTGRSKLITGLIGGTFYYFQNRAVNSAGGDWSASKTFTTDDAPVVSAPSIPDPASWSIADKASGGDAILSILALPSDGGRTITNFVARVNGGTQFSLATAAIGNVNVLDKFTDGVLANVELAAVNSIGQGPWSVAKQVTTTSGVANSTLPVLIGSLYAGGPYSAGQGIWTGSPTLVSVLWSSDTGTGGWTSQGDPGLGGTWAPALAGKYLRLDVTPNGNSALTASSAVYGPLGPAYAQVLDFSTTDYSYITAPVVSPFIGADLSTGANKGVWFAVEWYYDGIDTNFTKVLACLGTTLSDTYLALSPGEADFKAGGSTAQSLITFPAQNRGWHLTTGYFTKSGVPQANAQVFVDDITGTVGANASSSGAITDFDTLALGSRVFTTSAGVNSDRPISYVAVGRGNPSAAHTWAFNNGSLRPIWQYTGFNSSCSVDEVFLATKTQTGVATFTASELRGLYGTYQNWTLQKGSGASANQVGTLVWASQVPGFVDPNALPLGVPSAYISPAIGLTTETYQLNAADLNPGAAVKADFTNITITHSVDGAITPDVNGRFTVTNPGTIDWTMTRNGVVASGTAAGTDIRVVAPASLSTDSTFASLYWGNGRVAGIQPYPTLGAGSSPGSAANLQAAIALGTLAQGATLTVESFSDTANIITLDRDYGGAVIQARFRHGVSLKGIALAPGCANVTLRGFKAQPGYGIGTVDLAVNDTNGTGLGTEITIDQCRAGFLLLQGSSTSQSSGTCVVSNFIEYDDNPGTSNGTNKQSQFTGWSFFHAKNCAFAQSAPTAQDTVKIGGCIKMVFDRCFFGFNNESGGGAHADLVQTTTSNGPLGYLNIFFNNCVAINNITGVNRISAGGFFLHASKDAHRGTRFRRCLSDIIGGNPWTVPAGQQNIMLEDCTSKGNYDLGGATSFPRAIYAKNCVASKSTIVPLNKGVETGTTAITTFATNYQNWAGNFKSWKGYSNPQAGYANKGCDALIQELLTNESSYP